MTLIHGSVFWEKAPNTNNRNLFNTDGYINKSISSYFLFYHIIEYVHNPVHRWYIAWYVAYC